MQTFFLTLKEAALLWYEKDADHMAATVSYYALFAIAPLLFLSVAVSSMIYGKGMVVAVLDDWGSVLGADLIVLLHVAVQNLEALSVGFGLPIFGVLFFSGMVIIMFNTFTTGLHHIFGIPHRSFKGWVRKSLHSMVFVIVFQAYLLCLVLLDVGTQTFFETELLTWFVLQSIVFICATIVLFALAYRILPWEASAMRSCIYGAAVASVLFLVARMLVTFYVGATPVPGLYGAAGLILVLLIWIYVSTAVVYFGAAFAHVHNARINNK